MDRLFKDRLFQQLFPAGVVAAFLGGLVLAPGFAGSDVMGLLKYAALIGLAGSVGLFGLLKILDLRKKR